MKTLRRKCSILVIDKLHNCFATIHYLSLKLFRWRQVLFRVFLIDIILFLDNSSSLLICHFSIIWLFQLLNLHKWNHRLWFKSISCCLSHIFVNTYLLNMMKRMSLNYLAPFIKYLRTNDLQQNLRSCNFRISLVGSHSFGNYIFVYFYLC